MTKWTLEKVIEEGRCLTKNEYTYENAVYSGIGKKIEVTCKVHGSFFVKAYNHAVLGSGCKQCWNENRSVKIREARGGTQESFLQRAKETHGEACGYSKTRYLGYAQKIEIECLRNPEHGFFWQAPQTHLEGSGCPKCYEDGITGRWVGTVTQRAEEYFARCKEVHGDCWDYSKVVYTSLDKKIEIGCKIHGSFFWQSARNHLHGKAGCPVCGRNQATEKRLLNGEGVFQRFITTHGNKYNYSESNYMGMKVHINIVCNTCQKAFSQTPECHILGGGCPCQINNSSTAELELQKFIESLGVTISSEKYKLTSHSTIDIYIPDLNLGFEYNGLLWHSELYRSNPNYHLEKSELAKRQGIHLIHVWEDQWLFSKDRTKAWIRNILGLETQRSYARDLKVQQVSFRRAADFIETRHIQGRPAPAEYCYGLLDKQQNLLATMLFNPNNQVEDEILLTRFCSEGRVLGGFSKLLKAFEKEHGSKFSTLASFSEKSWSTGDVYFKNGFTAKEDIKPDYWWIEKRIRNHKRNYQKTKLANRSDFKFDPEMTEIENCHANGLYRVYDCGKIKWIKQLDEM